MTDDATRRQLRFSLFLQVFAAVMMGGAAAVRLASIGLDVVTALLLGGFALIVAAVVFTGRKIAQSRYETGDSP